MPTNGEEEFKPRIVAYVTEAVFWQELRKMDQKASENYDRLRRDSAAEFQRLRDELVTNRQWKFTNLLGICAICVPTLTILLEHVRLH